MDILHLSFFNRENGKIIHYIVIREILPGSLIIQGIHNLTGKFLWLKVGNYDRLLQIQVYLILGHWSNSLNYQWLQLGYFRYWNAIESKNKLKDFNLQMILYKGEEILKIYKEILDQFMLLMYLDA